MLLYTLMFLAHWLSLDARAAPERAAYSMISTIVRRLTPWVWWTADA